MNRLCKITIGCLFFLGILGGAGAASTPHVVLILVDDMGYGDPGCYNPESKIPTPNIDRLAREGMRFTDAHAPGALCHPSRYGLLTGRYPFRANVGAWRKQPVIEPDRMTVGTFLQSRGYRTAMVGKWHLGFRENGYESLLPGGPVDRGFDSFFGIRASTDIPPYFYIRNRRAVTPPTLRIEANRSEGWSPIQGAFWRAGGIAPDLNLEEVLPRFTREAVEIIGSHEHEAQNRPLMLYLAYPAPHTPWLPSAEFIGKSGAGSYGDFTVMVDAMIGRVLEALDASGLAQESLVIFTSDNGPVWYDPDVQRWGHDSSGGLRGMKGDAWENGHRMPFIVRWPGHVRPGTVTGQTICFTDVLATLAEVLDVSLPPGAGPDSFSFLPVLRERLPESKPVRGPLALPSANGTLSLRSGPWKLIDALGSGGFSKPSKITPQEGEPEGQLYHMGEDRNETRNLYLEHPDVVRRLRAELKNIVDADQTRDRPDASKSEL